MDLFRLKFDVVRIIKVFHLTEWIPFIVVLTNKLMGRIVARLNC